MWCPDTVTRTALSAHKKATQLYITPGMWHVHTFRCESARLELTHIYTCMQIRLFCSEHRRTSSQIIPGRKQHRSFCQNKVIFLCHAWTTSCPQNEHNTSLVRGVIEAAHFVSLCLTVCGSKACTHLSLKDKESAQYEHYSYTAIIVISWVRLGGSVRQLTDLLFTVYYI